jgi:hypothetical protein
MLRLPATSAQPAAETTSNLPARND